MRKIKMQNLNDLRVNEAFEKFVISKKAQGVKDVTIRDYHYHFRSMSKYLDVEKRFSELTQEDLDSMVVGLRDAGLASNTVSSYLRVFVTFLHWCNERGYTALTMKNLKQEETVKVTYTDDELERLLRRPKASCTFATFRTWIVINFLIDTGCRAATVCNILNCDVSLDSSQIIFRHTKNGKVQTIPISSRMGIILREYMTIRGGEPRDFLFCNEYGAKMTGDNLHLSIKRYNTSRGVDKTSVHLFRHTFARKYLLDCGGNAFTLQKLLGHSTLKMTKHYCAIYDADIAKDYDSVSPLANMQRTKDRIKK